jgi:predicted amidohydrolase YtcJ
VLSAVVAGSDATEGSRAMVTPGDRHSDRLLRTHSAKIFMDGSLEGETAALLEPYARGGIGMLVLPEADIDALVADLDARDAQIHFHAIGDRAARAALDALERARVTNGVRDNRHHISHLQLVHPDDHSRFATLNVAANFQALWAYPDAYITDLNLPAVGAKRVERMYPIGSLERAGARIVASSDWDVSAIDPLQAIETALTRRDVAGIVPGQLNEAERVSLETMLAAYTVNGAWLMNQEHRVGRIEPGMLADLAILERDLFAIPVDEIGEVRVLMTLFEGRPVYHTGELRTMPEPATGLPEFRS